MHTHTNVRVVGIKESKHSQFSRMFKYHRVEFKVFIFNGNLLFLFALLIIRNPPIPVLMSSGFKCTYFIRQSPHKWFKAPIKFFRDLITRKKNKMHKKLSTVQIGSWPRPSRTIFISLCWFLCLFIYFHSVIKWENLFLISNLKRSFMYMWSKCHVRKLGNHK